MASTIRAVTQEDIPLLSVIAKKAFYDTFTGTCTGEDMQSFLAEFYNEQRLSAELALAGNHFYFIETENRPVGYLQFMEDYSGLPLMKKWKALELKRIYLLQEFQGKGFAQEMIDFVIAAARQNGYEVIWLGVWEHNHRAKRFYEKNGFSFSGYTHDFPIGQTPQTDWWMWRFLDETAAARS